MTLYVVRHGRTEANASGLLLGRADPGLDAVGRRQADQIAAAIGPVSRVVTSPLIRCVETAQAITARPERDERLVELDYGEFDLRPLKEIPADVWARWRSDPTFRPPGGETLVELGERVGELLDEVAAEVEQGAQAGAGGDADVDDVVLVTHVSPVKAALAWALGAGVEVSWRSFVAQASITRIGLSERGPSLLSFNSEAHLSEG
ncbi:MAG: histidine phosphatase family protein [Actinomycetia bacterium]|nr:histidine phosphatase family protein [Actinomycetes bacterium]MCP5033625.1 histidine phosphatase family protein [Actinomycetes bacterium]